MTFSEFMTNILNDRGVNTKLVVTDLNKYTDLPYFVIHAIDCDDKLFSVNFSKRGKNGLDNLRKQYRNLKIDEILNEQTY